MKSKPNGAYGKETKHNEGDAEAIKTKIYTQSLTKWRNGKENGSNETQVIKSMFIYTITPKCIHKHKSERE